MTPTHKEMLKGATTWKENHEGVSIVLSHHGYSDGDEYQGARPHPGTWFYYLVIPEQMYPHRWADFACVRGPTGFETQGPAFKHDFFNSEITWSSSESYFCRKEMRMFDQSKVGCDYGHLWHMERGYPDTYESVKQDAILTAQKFLAAHPDRHVRSDYSGVWATPDEFYTAINGRTVHRSDDIPEGWETWMPKPDEAA